MVLGLFLKCYCYYDVLLYMDGWSDILEYYMVLIFYKELVLKNLVFFNFCCFCDILYYKILILVYWKYKIYFISI